MSEVEELDDIDKAVREEFVLKPLRAWREQRKHPRAPAFWSPALNRDFKDSEHDEFVIPSLAAFGMRYGPVEVGCYCRRCGQYFCAGTKEPANYETMHQYPCVGCSPDMNQ